MNPNGAVIYRGPSLIDGAPIVAIVTGRKVKSDNGKTGAMLQTWILREDVHPLDAVRVGLDESICGDCIHRRREHADGKLRRTCYVNVGQAPRSIWTCYTEGTGYADALSVRAITAIGMGRQVRLGSYGDPGAVPVAVWDALTVGSTGRTGYTHRAADVGAGLAHLCMASVDSPKAAKAAQRAGWRTFRVAAHGDDERMQGEARCPASEEAGKRVTCETCPMKCHGNVSGPVGVVIQAHGATKGAV